MTLIKQTVAAACMLFACAPSQAQTHDDFANYRRYADANAELGKSQEGEQRVVFLGNSITEGWVNTHPKFFTDNGYIGRGIGGQTSYQFLLRFREDVINLEPEVLVLNYGTNDIAENTGPYSEDITYGNILTMVELAQAHGISVILTSTLPASSFGWRPQITDAMEKIRSLNARVKAYADANGIPFVDYFNAMLSEDGTGMDSRYTPETVHPNSAGYDVMENLVVPVIKEML